MKPNEVMSVKRPLFYQSDEEFHLFIQSEKFDIENYEIKVKASSSIPSLGEVKEYLEQVKVKYDEFLKGLINSKRHFTDVISLPKNYLACNIKYEFNRVNIDKYGWFNIENFEANEPMEVSFTYVISYEEEIIMGEFKENISYTQIDESYKSQWLEYKIEKQWEINDFDGEVVEVLIPKVLDVQYFDKEENLTVGKFISIIMIMVCALSGLTYYELKEQRSRLEKSKRVQLIYFINNFVLMFHTGLTTQKSFKIALENRLLTIDVTHCIRPTFEELEKLVDQNISIYEIAKTFNEKFDLIESRRFIRLLLQNLRQGDHYLSIQLNQLSEKMWDERIRRARKESEKASSKLILPMMIVFIVIIMITVVPTFLGVSHI